MGFTEKCCRDPFDFCRSFLKVSKFKVVYFWIPQAISTRQCIPACIFHYSDKFVLTVTTSHPSIVPFGHGK